MTATPSQTIGPFFYNGMEWGFEASKGLTTAVVLTGRVLDGAGVAINDAMVEAWVPAAAEETQSGTPGYRRSTSTHGDNLSYRLELPVAPQPGEPAAYITVFARGLLKHQFTAVYLGDPGKAALLDQVPAARRATLIAERDAATGAWRWDIHMQGERETAFFEYR